MRCVAFLSGGVIKIILGDADVAFTRIGIGILVPKAILVTTAIFEANFFARAPFVELLSNLEPLGRPIVRVVVSGMSSNRGVVLEEVSFMSSPSEARKYGYGPLPQNEPWKSSMSIELIIAPAKPFSIT